MARKLIANVHVDGVVYGPDGEQDVPKDVADRIDNPNAWDESDGLLKGQEDPSSYDGVSAAELKKEIKRRNEGREDDDKLPTSGSQEELAAALLADDEPHTP
jgi:hypothetical protein